MINIFEQVRMALTASFVLNTVDRILVGGAPTLYDDGGKSDGADS